MNKKNELLISISIVIVLFMTYIFSNLTEEPAEKGKTSGAFRALQNWTAQRIYPFDDYPKEGFSQAFDYSKQNLTGKLHKNAAMSRWESIGPKNIGGRTLAVTLNPQNPNTIYAGSASGGLWRSFTAAEGAEAWHYVPTGFPVLAVSSIVISPKDTNVMYIGTGEVYNNVSTGTGYSIRSTRGSYGIGVLKSSDGGRTWMKSLDFSYDQRKGVEMLKLNPLNANTVWAGTTDGTYRSYDAGATWTLVDSVVMTMDIAVNPVDTNIVFATHGDLSTVGHGIYRTMDGGNTWEKLTAGLPSAFGGKAVLAIYPPSPNILYTSIGFSFGGVTETQLLMTDDNGDTWSLISDYDYSKYQGWYSHFVGINPSDSSDILVGGIDIYRLVSPAEVLVQKTWWWKWYFATIVLPGEPEGPSDYSHADHHSITYHPTNPDTIYLGTDGGIFRTTDGGETFRSLNGGYQTSQFYSGFSNSRLDSNLAIGGLQDNGSAIYYGFNAWMKVIGGDGAYTAINTSNDDIIYGSWYYLNIRKSYDRGFNFYENASPTNSSGENLNFISPFVMSPKNPDVIYAGGSKVHRTSDGGATWEVTNSGNALDGVTDNPVLCMAISETDQNVVYAATAPWYGPARIYRTMDGGTNWIDVTGEFPDRYITDLALDPNNDFIVVATFSGFGSSHVFRSEDAGTNWTDIGSGLPDVPTNAAFIDPRNPSHIYIGNDLGVYVSRNNGAVWEEFMDGLPDAVIAMDLTYSPKNRNLRVATHGNGVYQASLQGVVGVEEETPALVREFALSQNYPNPFNVVTTIRYILRDAADVNITVYDLNGREVTLLLEKEMPAGVHNVVWSASAVPSGVYFYRLSASPTSVWPVRQPGGRAGDFTISKKMVLLK